MSHRPRLFILFHVSCPLKRFVSSCPSSFGMFFLPPRHFALFPRKSELLRRKVWEMNGEIVGVFLGYRDMELANRIICCKKFDDKSSDAREGFVVHLSEAAEVDLSRDGPYVTGFVEDCTRRDDVQAKLDAAVRPCFDPYFCGSIACRGTES